MVRVPRRSGSATVYGAGGGKTGRPLRDAGKTGRGRRTKQRRDRQLGGSPVRWYTPALRNAWQPSQLCTKVLSLRARKPQCRNRDLQTPSLLLANQTSSRRRIRPPAVRHGEECTRLCTLQGPSDLGAPCPSTDSRKHPHQGLWSTLANG